jgi:hypothetical protein
MTFSTTAEFITPSWLKQMQQIGRLLSGTISSKECLSESFLARQVPSRVEVGAHLSANLRPEGKAARPTQISARPKMIVFGRSFSKKASKSCRIHRRADVSVARTIVMETLEPPLSED